MFSNALNLFFINKDFEGVAIYHIADWIIANIIERYWLRMDDVVTGAYYNQNQHQTSGNNDNETSTSQT